MKMGMWGVAAGLAAAGVSGMTGAYAAAGPQPRPAKNE